MPITNHFVIPTDQGEVNLHVTPGPCTHEEHWLDPLLYGFRENLRAHVPFHAVIGIGCILIQIGSRTSEFVWYGRAGLGTWAGSLFFCTCLVGSYATKSDHSPKQMRSWMYVYMVFCFLSGWSAGCVALVHVIYYHLHFMADWQTSLLTLVATIEFLFCIIEFTLVIYRICSAGAVPQGFDFHVTVECAPEHRTTTATGSSTADNPPPSYEQIYLTDIIARSISGEISTASEFRRDSDTENGADGTDIGLRVMGHSVTPSFVSRNSSHDPDRTSVIP